MEGGGGNQARVEGVLLPIFGFPPERRSVGRSFQLLGLEDIGDELIAVRGAPQASLLGFVIVNMGVVNSIGGGPQALAWGACFPVFSLLRLATRQSTLSPRHVRLTDGGVTPQPLLLRRISVNGIGENSVEATDALFRTLLRAQQNRLLERRGLALVFVNV